MSEPRTHQNGIVPAADRRVVRRAAARATSLRETATMLRTCDAYEQRARTSNTTPPYALALCACWREELRRRRREIERDAHNAARSPYITLDDDRE